MRDECEEARERERACAACWCVSYRVCERENERKSQRKEIVIDPKDC